MDSKDEELARLTEETRRLNTLLDTVDDVLILLGPDERTIYANAAAIRLAQALTGQPASELLGKSIHELNMPEAMLRQAGSLTSKVKDTPGFTEEILVPFPSGARWGESKIRAVKSPDGRLEAFTITARDIHERVLAREKLAEALAFREHIIGILSHDMRNPLSAIEGLSTLTLRRSDLPNEVRARFEQIEQAAQRTLEMIGTLLDFTESRFRAPFKISLVPTDMHATCRLIVAGSVRHTRGAQSSLASKATDASIAIQLAWPRSSPTWSPTR